MFDILWLDWFNFRLPGVLNLKYTLESFSIFKISIKSRWMWENGE